MHRLAVGVLAVLVLGATGCWPRIDNPRKAKEAVVRHLSGEKKIPRKNYRILSVDRDGDDWSVHVTRVPRMPSGSCFLIVTEDGVIEEFWDKTIREIRQRSQGGGQQSPFNQ